MRFPDFLQEGETIGFIAPSFGASIEPYHSRFQNALRIFEQKGYESKIGPNCFRGDGIGISASPFECAVEFMEAYEDAESKVLISCGGGELMCRILPHIDFERVKKATPKWFLGYSDNTNLSFLLTTVCDVASVYGPCAGTFGMEPWHESITDAFDTIKGQKNTYYNYKKFADPTKKNSEEPLVAYEFDMPTTLKAFEALENFSQEEDMLQYPFAETESVEMEGRLIGGCMDCLITLTGTQFDCVDQFLESYKEDGFIWFLEACDLNVFSMTRAVWQMKNAGWFRYVKGFLIGRPMHYGETFGELNQYNAILAELAQLKVPVIMDVDLGHVSPQMPFICGAYAKISYNRRELIVTQECK